MKSIKTKLILGITSLILIGLAIIISVSVIKSTNTIEEVTNYQYQQRNKAAIDTLEMNLYEKYTVINLKDGNLVDKNGNKIDLTEFLDKFSKSMGVVNTIFIKDGSDYVRVFTTVKDNNGNRVVGTKLDTTGQAYKAIENGKEYFGVAQILGKEYLAGYIPLYDSNKNIIGIVFSGESTTKINSMISSSKNKTMTIIILTAIIIFILSIIDIYIISSIVAKQIKEASYMVKELKLGHYNYRLKNKLKDEMGQMSRDMNELADDLQNVVLADMKKISAGDVNIELIPKDENDELTPTLMEMVNSIKDLVYETKNLAIEAENGNLNARGDAEKFKGEYINIVNAINGTLEAVANPMKEAIRVMGDLSVGKLGSTINGTYNGDYAKLIDAVNKMARTLTYVLNEISEIITRIADADLNITDITNYDGDFNKVTVAFNNIIENLNATMREINAAAVQVAAGSGQIADSSVMLSQGSEEQASSIEEITSAITQMAAQVNENAQNAAQADSLSRSAKGSAIKGNEEMHKMLEAMHEINEASNGISKIIKVIDDIAFQTNILALNAAVEAARAGQYGKGFAVVAEEVRNLAQKSAAAAKETTVMIESSIDKVKFGTEIANSTEQALEEIVGNVSKSSELVSHIASASNEQASAISQVSQAIEQVSGVVQTNSATAEETASASEELTSQAQMLKSMVNRFKLKDDLINSSVSIPKINEAKKSSIDLEAFETDINKSMKNTQIDLGKDF